MAQLSTAGFGSQNNLDSTQSYSALTLNNVSSGAFVTSILWGARVSGDTTPDYFKVTGLQVTPTPEPGTFALMGSALVGLVCARRRKRVSRD
jgi:hypothetical protein